MNKFVLLYQEETEQIAKELAVKLKCRKTICLNKIADYPENIEAVNLGFVLSQYKHSLSENTLKNMKSALCICKPSCLEYMFSVCVGDKKPHYSLKIAERLCIKSGFGVSYSSFIKTKTEEKAVEQIAEDVAKGEIKLPNRCFAPNLYARLKGIR